jgi:Flp pilus assembly protein TadG
VHGLLIAESASYSADKDKEVPSLVPKRQRGSALIEFLFTFPFLFFFFLGALDMGFYCNALISVEDAARTIALYASSPASNGTCPAALLANLNGATCTIVPATSPDKAPGANAVTVTVTYQTPQLLPFSGFPGRLTISRSVIARSRS